MAKFAFRLETKRIRETDFPYAGASPITSPEAVVSFAKSLEESDIEKMLVLHLNSKNKLIGIQVTPGTVNQQVIYPREIVKQALLAGSAAVILVHNHPSGDPTSSPEDRHLTKTIQDACRLLNINVLDHIILGDDGRYMSMCQNLQMPAVAKDGQFSLVGR